MSSVMELGLGLGLAGAAGIRTYLPLIIVGLLTRFSQTFGYRVPFTVFATGPVLLLLLVLAGYELLVERSDDQTTQELLLVSTLRALGGAILLAGLFGGFGTLIGVVLGGITALAVHLIKIRLWANYIRPNQGHSLRTGHNPEDLAAIAGVLLALLVPWSSYIILAGLVITYLRKAKYNNGRYKSDTRARSWR